MDDTKFDAKIKGKKTILQVPRQILPYFNLLTT